jgi:hypothetical protein
MLTASKPLKDEPDKFVNGYIIGTGIRKYNEKGEEIYEDKYEDEDIPTMNSLMNEEQLEEDAYKRASNQYDFDEYDDNEADEYINSIDEDSKDFKDCLLLNNVVGFYARTKAGKKFNVGRDTDEIKNEVGWINEYYFGYNVKPAHYGGPPIEPDISKYESQAGYDAPWDFTRSNWSAEIKTSSEYSMGGNQYPDRLYYVQTSKFKNPPTERFSIWWAEIDSYQETLITRSEPSSWKYFETTQTEWKEYKIVKDKGLYHNNIKIAGYDTKQGGAQYGPQLYFFSPEYAAYMEDNKLENNPDTYGSELKTF